MLHSAESIFRQFEAEYLREFEKEFENILGVYQGPRGSLFMEKNICRKSREAVSLSQFV
jgi:hypothetical protein